MEDLVLNIVIILKNSNVTELHHAQDELNFENNEKIQDLLVILLLEKIAVVPFLDLALKIDRLFEGLIFLINLHQDHVQDLPLHREYL